MDLVCESTQFQKYKVENQEYKNVIGSIGIEHEVRMIIGAHYDVYGNSQGADDNASGVAGVLELARLLSKSDLKFRIDFVFYTLEEPPFFRAKDMGSYIHAKSLKDQKANIIGMICLESIGYFSDKPNSQKYPVEELSKVYGTKGDFITVVQNDKKEKFSSTISHLIIKQNLIETKSFIGSSNLVGVDFSDHLNYWNFGFPAIMITNTAFYRNNNYHTKEDTIQTIDIDKIILVVNQLSKAIMQY